MKIIFSLIIIIFGYSPIFAQKIIDIYKPDIINNGTGYSNHDQSFGIFEDGLGNLYQTGYYEGEITFGTSTLVSSGDRDIFVAKINKNGGWDWAVSAGGLSTDFGKDITCDNSGNIYVTGYFYGTCNFGNTALNSSGNTDLFVAKLNSSGEWIWAVSGNGTGFNKGISIVCDNSDNVYVSGSFESTINFGNLSLTSAGQKDIFVAKLNSSGIWSWASKAGGTSTDENTGMKYNSANSFLGVTGFYSGSSTFGSTTLTAIGSKDIYVARIDLDGNWVWAKSAGTSGTEESRAIAIDANGNSVITGIYTSSITFGSTTLPAASGRDIYIAKIDKSGNWVWAKNATGNEDDEANSIGLDNAGNAYITGSFYSDVKFGSNELFALAERNMYVARISSAGNWSWGRLINGNSAIDGFSISVATNGVCFVTGAFYSDANVGFDSLKSKGESDIIVSRITAAGQWVWGQSNGGITGIVSSEQVGIDSTGNIIMAGYFQGTVKFGNETIISLGKKDFFIAKSSPEGVWIKAVSFGGPGDDFCNSAAIDNLGNIYITGSFEDYVSIDSNLYTSLGFNDIFIMKLNSALNSVWFNATGDTDNDYGKKVAVKNGKLVVTGVYAKKPYFGITRLSAKGNDDVFVTKLDFDGNYIWALSCGSTQYEYVNNLVIDNSQNILITGGFESTCSFGLVSFSSVGGDDIFVAKASANGQWIWALKAGTTGLQESGNGLTVDLQNNVFLTGNYKGLCLFGDQYHLSNGSTDIFLSKIDSSGNWIWTKSIGGTGSDYAYDLSNVNNTLQMVGYVTSPFILNGKNFKANGNTRNGFISAFDTNGDILWVLSDESNGFSEINSICKDKTTNAVIGGRFINKFSNSNKTLLGYNNVDINSFWAVAGFTLSKPDWQFRDSTGLSTIVKVPANINPKINGRNISVGDAIGVFFTRNSNYYCAGMKYWNGNDLEITVWGDDTNTPIKDGFNPNENYSIRVWDAIKAEDVLSKVRYSQGPDKFINNSYSIISQLPIIYDTLKINLAKGWNMISSYNMPEFPRMDSVFKDIKSQINLVKSSSGQTYIPQFNINSIGNWDIKQGYQVFANEITTLVILGDFVKPEDITMNIPAGWSIISYLRNSQQNIATSLSSLVSQNKLILAKNSTGSSYIPQFNINGIGNMKPGQAYQVYLSGTAQFTYPANE
jgi:hypothetical protein